jgi:hypothetical protein
MALTKPDQRLMEQLGERINLAEGKQLQIQDTEVARRKRVERESEVHQLTRRAHEIAKTRCIFSGSHVYLGSDALSRDYHSEWFPVELLPTTDNRVIVDAQLEYVNSIARKGSVEVGERFRHVTINLRYRDELTSASTDPLVFCELAPDAITLSPRREDRSIVDPHTETWGEITTLLDKLEFLDPLRLAGQ